MVMLNREALRYLKTVYRLLPCKRYQRRKIISEIKNSVALFLADNPDSDYDSIATRFGNPKVVAASLVEEMQSVEILQELQIKRRIMAAVFTAVSMIVVIWLAVAGVAYIQYVDEYNGYFNVSVETENDIQNVEGVK